MEKRVTEVVKNMQKSKVNVTRLYNVMTLLSYHDTCKLMPTIKPTKNGILKQKMSCAWQVKCTAAIHALVKNHIFITLAVSYLKHATSLQGPFPHHCACEQHNFF